MISFDVNINIKTWSKYSVLPPPPKILGNGAPLSLAKTSPNPHPDFCTLYVCMRIRKAFISFLSLMF